MKWADKLIGKHFTIVTDHKSLTHFQTQRDLSRRQVRWANVFQMFDFEILHEPGKTLIVPDALSRYFDSDYVGEQHPDYRYANADARLDSEGEDLPAVRALEIYIADVTVEAPDRIEQSVRMNGRAPERDDDRGMAYDEILAAEEEDETITDRHPSDTVGTSQNRLNIPPEQLGDQQFLAAMKKAYIQDVIFKKVIGAIEQHKHYALKSNGILYHDKRMCVPKFLHRDRSSHEVIITHCHHAGGHKAMRRTIDYVRKWFYWPSLVHDIQKFCESCERCQTDKTSTQRPAGLLHSLPVPQRPWESIGIDFVGPLPLSLEYDYMMVVVCRLTSQCHLCPTKTTATAARVAYMFYRDIVRLHGIPKTIVSDRDVKFIAKFWRELHRLCGTKLLMSSAYHPQTDGASENMVKNASQVLRTYVSNDQRDWARHTPMAEFAINSTTNQSTGFTPFELNYGYTPSLGSLMDMQPTAFPGVTAFAEQARFNVLAAHDAIIASRVDQTHYANRLRREDPPLEVNDKVYLSTANMRLPKSRARKLAPKYIGPFKILEAFPMSSNYRIELPEALVKRRIHPTFHISQLRPHVASDNKLFPQRAVELFYDFGTDIVVEYFVHEILTHRWNSNDSLEFKVKWAQGDITWEPLDAVQDVAPMDDYLELNGADDNPHLLSRAAQFQKGEETGTSPATTMKNIKNTRSRTTEDTRKETERNRKTIKNTKRTKRTK